MILDPATAAVATGVPARTIRRWVLDHGVGQRLAVNIGYVAGLTPSRGSGLSP